MADLPEVSGKTPENRVIMHPSGWFFSSLHHRRDVGVRSLRRSAARSLPTHAALRAAGRQQTGSHSPPGMRTLSFDDLGSTLGRFSRDRDDTGNYRTRRRTLQPPQARA